MQEKCFFNRKSEMQIGFSELKRINRISLGNGEVSGPISLKENGYIFVIICLQGVCAFYAEPENEDSDPHKMKGFIFAGSSISSKEMNFCEKYYIKNKGDNEALVLIQKIKT